MTSDSLVLIRQLNERAKIFRRLDDGLKDVPEHVLLARQFYSLVEQAFQISVKLNEWSDTSYRASLLRVTTGRKDGSGNREE